MFGFLIGGNQASATMKQKKAKHKKGTKQHDLHKLAKSTLGSGDLRQACKLPKGEELNEWLAVNSVDFFNVTNLLYGSLSEFCTGTSCPTMNAGQEYEYLWSDPPDIKTPIKCTAPEYMGYLMVWTEKKINDSTLFPSSIDTPFPANFKNEIKNIFKRLFRVYAHIYHCHFSQVEKLGEAAHVNTAFKHFILFIFEFELVSKKELEPMKSIIVQLLGPEYEEKFSKKKK